MTKTETMSDGSEYERLTDEEQSVLSGKRIVGHGKITSLTNSVGDLHPAVIETEDGSLFTPPELRLEDFDQRHGPVDF